MVRLGQKGIARVGRDCLKYLKKGVEPKRGEGKQILKRGEEGEQAGPKGGCLKKGGLEPPYELCLDCSLCTESLLE